MKRVIAAGLLVAGLSALVADSRSDQFTGRQSVIRVAGLVSDDEKSGDRKSGDENVAARDKWMKAKQIHAQDIFAGLTDGDFDRMATSGRLLLGSGILEAWLKSREFTKQSDYRGQMYALEYANKELIRHAEDRNMEGALSAYVSLSQACVRCHMLLRD